MGYSDLGCYGSEIHTPNLDALAAGGMRFTQMYNGGRCCPTRAALLTGLYPHRAGVGRMTNDANLPGYRGRLLDNTLTVAELLHAAGYRTAMSGKWHLSNTTEEPDHLKHLNNQSILETFGDPKTYPIARGFESYYGPIWGVANYFDPFSLVENRTAVREVPNGYYITDAITDHAEQDIAAYGAGTAPFFLYVAYTAPHWPLQAPPEDIKRYESTYRAGWDAVRAARHAKMKQLGILPPGGETLGPRHDPTVKWENNPARDWDARAMAVHAAMVDRMDNGIGRIVAKLREMNQLDNTLILFLSDNGASNEIPTEPGFDRPSETRDGRPIQYFGEKKTLPGGETTFGSIGPFWASVVNSPLRLWKSEMYEGGICTPMVAHWPAGIGPRAGSVTNEVGHVIDVMATFAELAGVHYPAGAGERPVPPTPGQSLIPILQGKPFTPHPILAWEHIGARAIREGDWKLVAHRIGPWALYDLSVDRAEQNDLSATQPDRVAAMEKAWQTWAEGEGVLPAPPGGRWGKPAAGPSGQ